MQQPAAARVNFVRAFLSSALATGLSRVLGAGRDSVIAGFLGAGEASDAFNLAFTIPNVFRRFVADEGLTGAMIPALAKAEAEGGQAALQRLGSSTFAALVIANLVLCVLGITFAEPLVLAFAWPWRDQPELLAFTVSMTRWMFPFVAMVSFVSYFEGLLNYRGHFFWPKFAPALVSAGVVGGAFALGPFVSQPAWALVFGTMAGGLAHVLVNLPPLLKRWGPLGFVVDFRSRAVRSIATEMTKVIAIGVFAQVNFLVLQQLATSLPAGSLTVYRNSTHLTDLAQGIVAVGIGSALLPNISASVASADWARFREELAVALRLAAFLLVPAAVTLVAFGTPIAALLFRWGAYSWEDVQLTGELVQCLAPFILAVAGINIFKKVYFAIEDRGTLLRVGALGVAITGFLGFFMTRLFGVQGLALALSASTVLQLCAYVLLLSRRLGENIGIGALVGPMARIVSANVPLGLVWAMFVPLGHWQEGPASIRNWLVAATAGCAAGIVYLVAGHLLGVKEIAKVTSMVRRRMRR
jgi:putative peptidoglycan lipid II flippase